MFFFFSSRRRHTRLQGDWSSDVCSSDLHQHARRSDALGDESEYAAEFATLDVNALEQDIFAVMTTSRSEERRVGKECRSRRAPDHERKKKSEKKNEKYKKGR